MQHYKLKHLTAILLFISDSNMVEFVPLLIRVAALLSTASGITIFAFSAQAEAEARHFWWVGVAPALSGALAFWQPNRAVVISALVRATCSAYSL